MLINCCNRVSHFAKEHPLLVQSSLTIAAAAVTSLFISSIKEQRGAILPDALKDVDLLRSAGSVTLAILAAIGLSKAACKGGVKHELKENQSTTPMQPIKVANSEPHSVQEMNKQSFREFLNQEGLIGLPDELEVTLEATFSRFTELAPFAAARDIKGEKGILLYGPPGTGKTSLARAIAKYLNCPADRIKTASGTTLLNMYVGQTEERIRDLFQPARDAHQQLGSKSPLYVVIIDEFEAIARNRSQSHNSWEATPVNELLNRMEGYFVHNNLLVIATTNLENVVDPALLRPGRFGVQVKFELPNFEQRKEIWGIYLKTLKQEGLLHKTVDVEELSKKTEGFSGAEIKGMVEKANQTAFNRMLKKYRAKQCALEEFQTNPASSVSMQDLDEVIETWKRNNINSQTRTNELIPNKGPIHIVIPAFERPNI